LAQRAADELWATRKAWAIDIFGELVVAVILIWSCARFMRRVVRLPRRGQLSLLAGVLALDAGVFLLGAAPFAMYWSLVAMPLAILVALVEVATCAAL
jgi:hypothetical protein